MAIKIQNSVEQLHELTQIQTQLSILSYLYDNGTISFSRLTEGVDKKSTLVSSTLQILKERKHINLQKEVNDGRTETLVTLTDTGKVNLEGYYEKLKNLPGGLK